MGHQLLVIIWTATVDDFCKQIDIPTPSLPRLPPPKKRKKKGRNLYIEQVGNVVRYVVLWKANKNKSYLLDHWLVLLHYLTVLFCSVVVQSTQPLAERDLYLSPLMQIAPKHVLTDIVTSLLKTDKFTHMFLMKHV